MVNRGFILLDEQDLKRGSKRYMRRAVIKIKIGLLIIFALLFTLSPASNADASGRLGKSKPRATKKKRSRTPKIKPAIGVLVQTLGGETLISSGSEQRFNPASVVKIATSFAALEKLGYDYRFSTEIYMDGEIGPDGVLQGDLVIVGGGDPGFYTENALLIAEKLHNLGLRYVTGDLVVVAPFYFNFDPSPARSGTKLLSLFKGGPTSSAWERYLVAVGRPWTEFKGIEFGGLALVKTQSDTPHHGLRLILTHLSLPLSDLLKKQNDFSNNFMAEVIGRHIGGPHIIEQFLVNDVGLSAEDIRISTASGLGVNWITPRAALQLFRGFYKSVNSHGKKIEDLLPVAGVDPGTLEDRFNDQQFSGSVVAKTGTLFSRHASALVGMAYTRERGVILFAILNRDLVSRARQHQDDLLNEIILQCGGPMPQTIGTGLQHSPTESPQIVIFQGSPNQ
jgi:serine-type D-Ala-D-Ala carboxypeptidase/endopeptidase (penicillin-binding protein 4)